MVNILILIVLAALAVLFLILAVRSWRVRRLWLRWPAMILSGLLGLLLLVVTGVSALGFYRLAVPPATYTVSDVQVEMTPERVARGERLAAICADCHSTTGVTPLDGSKEDFFADPAAPPLGSMWGPNLTPAGDLKNWSDGEIMRALREGIGKDGQPLVIMPSMAMRNMSDEDAYALVAYLRSQPAVGDIKPKRNLSVVAAFFIGSGIFPTSAQTPITAPIVAPPTGTPEYGQYLTKAVGCIDCHGANLDGVITGNSFIPAAPNLRASVPDWTEEQFIKFFRSGELPNGRVAVEGMPWASYNKVFTDDELRDIYSFIVQQPLAEK